MNFYIVKPNRSISTNRGIIGAPIDPKNPTKNEIITVKDFGTERIDDFLESKAQQKLNLVLQSEKCPLELFAKTKQREVETTGNDENDILSKKENMIKENESKEQPETTDKPLKEILEDAHGIKAGEGKGAQKK